MKNFRIFIKKTKAFITKDFLITSSYKMALIISLIGGIFPVFSYYFINVLMKGHTPKSLIMYGGNYFSFSLIGVAFMGYFTLALKEFSSSMRRAQMAGCLEAILSSQTNPKHIILMSAFFNFIFNGILLVAMFSIGILFLGFDISNINVIGFLISLILSFTVFISLGIFSAAGTILFKRGEPFSFIFTTLSSLIGGAIFPVSILPGVLKKISYFIPFYHSLEAIRLTVLRGYTIRMVASHLIVLCLLIVILLPSSLYFFQWAVNKGKKEGTLITY